MPAAVEKYENCSSSNSDDDGGTEWNSISRSSKSGEIINYHWLHQLILLKHSPTAPVGQLLFLCVFVCEYSTEASNSGTFILIYLFSPSLASLYQLPG